MMSETFMSFSAVRLTTSRQQLITGISVKANEQTLVQFLSAC